MWQKGVFPSIMFSWVSIMLPRCSIKFVRNEITNVTATATRNTARYADVFPVYIIRKKMTFTKQ